MTPALGTTRRTVLAFGTALVGLWLVPAAAEDWQEYRPEGLSFRVELPGSPAIGSGTIDGTIQLFPILMKGLTKWTSLEVRFEPLNLSAYHFELPRVITPEEIRENVSKEGMIIVRDEEVVVTGVPGREFALQLKDGRFRVMRFVIADKRFIFVMVSDKSVQRNGDTIRHPVAERFLGSFALLPPLAR